MKYCLPAILGLGLFFQASLATDSAAASSAQPHQEATILGTPAAPPSDKSKFQIFLLVGQSNMSGRAPLVAGDEAADPRVLVFNRLDQWYSQGEPIHYDKPKDVAVGPGFTFAKLLAAREPGMTIGLVPCAFGGTSLLEWDPSSKDLRFYPPDNLYNNAIRRAKLAMQSGTLAGILWHQGESDSTSHNPPLYANKLAKLVASFRSDLNAPNVPFIAGEIGYFNYTKTPGSQIVNQQIDSIAGLIPNSGVASADGLTDRGDHLHFNNASQKELAQRYVDAFLKLQAKP